MSGLEAIGAASSIASLFNTAIECFKYIRVAKSFGDRYQSALLDLDSAQLRLSRWGDAVHLSGGGVTNSSRLPRTLANSTERELAERMLKHIIHLFDVARTKADQIDKRQHRSTAVADEEDSEDDEEPDHGFLAIRGYIRRIVEKRQNRASVREMTKWVIYNEGEFTALIADIKRHTDDLINGFPALEEQNTKLCKSEVGEFTMTLQSLAIAAQNQDELLADQLSKMLQPVVR